jgi:hypothetical protein
VAQIAAGTIRQVADSLARQQFGAHAFTQEQDFRTEMVGLLTRMFSQIGAADPPETLDNSQSWNCCLPVPR